MLPLNKFLIDQTVMKEATKVDGENVITQKIATLPTADGKGTVEVVVYEDSTTVKTLEDKKAKLQAEIAKIDEMIGV